MNQDCELVIKVEINLTSSMHSAKILWNELGSAIFFIGDWLVTVNWGSTSLYLHSDAQTSLQGNLYIQLIRKRYICMGQNQ